MFYVDKLIKVKYFSFSFSLFEAMSAIEMMDPKMDAGMLCNQTKRKVLNFDQSIQVINIFKCIFRVFFLYILIKETVFS